MEGEKQNNATGKKTTELITQFAVASMLVELLSLWL